MYYVGIDIAKSFHVVTIINENEVRVFAKPFKVLNTHDGYHKFIDKLNSLSPNVDDFMIGLEATGIYGENLLEFLKSHKYDVKLLNPFQTKRYREQHTMKKVKNDNIDSWIIALFLKDGKFSSGYVTDDEYQGLRTLYRNRASIQSDMKEVKKRILTQVTVTFPELENFIDIFTISGLSLLDKYPTAAHYERSSVDRIMKIFRHIKGNNFTNEKALKVLELAKNSVYSGKAKDARAIAIKSSIRLLQMYSQEISLLEQEILALLEGYGIKEEKDVPTNSLIENLKTIPGVSSKTIAAVISECGDLTRFPTVTKFIGSLGLFPTENSSGNSKSTGHLSKRGSSLVKHALYMASVSCLLHNKELKQYYDTKKLQGKSKQEWIIAVARKLATIIYSIFKYNTPYEPSRVFSKA
jgi:transposase